MSKSINLLEFCEKISVPLLSVACKSCEGTTDVAKTLSDLLYASANAGVDIGRAVEIDDADDSQRLACGAIAAPIISSFYEANKKAPSSDDVASLVSAIKDGISASKNFGASKGASIESVNLPSGALNVYALSPLVTCVEKSEVEKITPKLIEKASLLAGLTGDGADNDAAKISALRSVVGVYVECCKKDAKNAWDLFEQSFDMLKTIAEGLTNKPSDKDSASEKPKDETKKPPLAIRRSPAAKKKDISSEPSDVVHDDAPPQEEKKTTTATTTTNANPMSFFKKKKEEDE